MSKDWVTWKETQVKTYVKPALYLQKTRKTNNTIKIAKDTKLELPMWIAEVLAVCMTSEESSTAFIELIQPEAINTKVINAIKTSSTSLDVHSISQHYYALVQKWGELFTDKELVDVVQQVSNGFNPLCETSVTNDLHNRCSKKEPKR